MADVIKYTAITFAPVQGFIEKSRKLRDLYGASLILSYLSQQIVIEASKTTIVISPSSPNLQKGMPNRILIKGEFSKQQVEQTLLTAWKEILQKCQYWIEEKLPHYTYHWGREWINWGNHTWEIFWGEGYSIQAAMDNLETQKLSRGWTALNWIGESSSLTGTDAIAFPGLGAEDRNPKNRRWRAEKNSIDDFYRDLSNVIEKPNNEEEAGKFLASNERLSIPELTKRLITYPQIAIKIGMAPIKSFSEMYRLPEEKNEPGSGRWTGWFIGDGDKVGDYLKQHAQQEEADKKISSFSHAMRNWGREFSEKFPKNLGRIVYAGGDDFLGVIFSQKEKPPIQPKQAYQWLLEVPQQWEKHGQKIGVSVGFVWAGHSVPQRDILQHCREAEKVAKSLGRNRVTIRILFNSGQYVQWTCPWNYLDIFTKYQDRERNSNWGHIYQDLAYLESRRTFKIDNRNTATSVQKSAIQFLDIYFPGEAKKFGDNNFVKHLVGFSESDNAEERAIAVVGWISDLVKVGWHLCSNI